MFSIRLQLEGLQGLRENQLDRRWNRIYFAVPKGNLFRLFSEMTTWIYEIGRQSTVSARVWDFMRKMPILFCLLVMLFSSALAAPEFDLKQLQGSWWSDPGNTTSDFSIDGDKVWLDFDGEYHPCRIEGDILIFELAHGLVENKIISIDGDRLVLEYTRTKERTVLTRAK